jgi:hypothetical protein
MITDKHIQSWLDYMTTQKILQHFRPIHEVPTHKICYWGKLKFPILGATYGTHNHPKIKILDIYEFVNDGYFEKWAEIKKNPHWKYDSNCNILAYANR